MFSLLKTIYNKHAFQFKYEQCVFLGYNPNHKGYICLAQSRSIYIFRHVKFDETLFPFQVNPKLHSSNSGSAHKMTFSFDNIPTLVNISCSNRFKDK